MIGTARDSGKRPLFPQEVEKIPAFYILHRDELQAAAFAEIVNTKDIGVRNPAGELQLLLEPLQSERILGDIQAEDLQRDGAVEFLVAGFIDFAHPSNAEKGFDLVTRAKVFPERE